MSNLTYVEKNTPIFFLGSNSLEERLDPYYYNSALKDFTESIHFEVVKIKQVVKSFQSGFGVGRQDQANDESDGIIQIRPTNLNNYGELKFDKNVFIPKELITSEKHLLQKGDVVFNNTNSQEWVGKTAFYDLDERLAFSNHITVLKVDKDKIEPEYLWIILNLYQQKKIFFSICTNWNNQSGVGLELLKNLKIPLPKQDKQREIIDCLKLGYSQKHLKEAEAQKLLDSIDEYLLGELGITLPQKDNSLENRMFTTFFSKVSSYRLDPIMTDFNFNISGAKYPMLKLGGLLVKKPQYGANEAGIDRKDETTPRYIRITDININGFLKGDLGKTAEVIEDKYFLNDKDILIARSGNTVGKSYIHFKDQYSYDCFFAGYMIRFIPDHSKLLPEFLFAYTQSKLYDRWVEAIQRAAGQPNINAQEYMSLLVPTPPISKQKEIVSRIFDMRSRVEKLYAEAKIQFKQKRYVIEQMILKN